MIEDQIFDFLSAETRVGRTQQSAKAAGDWGREASATRRAGAAAPRGRQDADARSNYVNWSAVVRERSAVVVLIGCANDDDVWEVVRAVQRVVRVTSSPEHQAVVVVLQGRTRGANRVGLNTRVGNRSRACAVLASPKSATCQVGQVCTAARAVRDANRHEADIPADASDLVVVVADGANTATTPGAVTVDVFGRAALSFGLVVDRVVTWNQVSLEVRVVRVDAGVTDSSNHVCAASAIIPSTRRVNVVMPPLAVELWVVRHGVQWVQHPVRLCVLVHAGRHQIAGHGVLVDATWQRDHVLVVRGDFFQDQTVQALGRGAAQQLCLILAISLCHKITDLHGADNHLPGELAESIDFLKLNGAVAGLLCVGDCGKGHTGNESSELQLHGLKGRAEGDGEWMKPAREVPLSDLIPSEWVPKNTAKSPTELNFGQIRFELEFARVNALKPLRGNPLAPR